MSAESSSTKDIDAADERSHTERSLFKFVGIFLLAAAVFFTSQIGVLIAVGVGSTVFGLNEAQRDALLSDTSYWPKLAIYAAISASMVGLVVFIVRSIWFASDDRSAWARKTREFLLLQKHRYSLDEAVEVLGIYGFYFLTTLVVTVFVNVLGIIDTSTPQNLGITDPSSIAELAAIFVMLVVLPPIGEEILFRGFLFRGLAKYGSTIPAYVVTSVLFGLAHMQLGEGGPSWNAVLDTMIFSGFLIHIMRRHGSLYSAMLLHGIKNAVAFLILFGVNWL